MVMESLAHKLFYRVLEKCFDPTEQLLFTKQLANFTLDRVASRPTDHSYNLRVREPPAMHVTTIMILIDETAVSIEQ